MKLKALSEVWLFNISTSTLWKVDSLCLLLYYRLPNDSELSCTSLGLCAILNKSEMIRPLQAFTEKA